MERRHGRKVALDALPWLKSAMMLNSWTVDLNWIDLEPCMLARCAADARYKLADIQIDLGQINNDAHLLQTLRHELAHILHAEFKLYRRATNHLISQPACDSLGEVYGDAEEKTVRAIEDMLEIGLGLTTAKMITIAKRRAR